MSDDAQGTQDAGTGTQDAGTQQAAASQQQPATITSVDQIPQALRNQLESNHRKGLQEKIASLQEQNANLSQLREQSSNFMDLIGDRVGELDPAGDLGDVATQITGTLDSLKTEQERLVEANKLKATELKTAQDAQTVMQQELFDTLKTNQLMAHLGVNEEGKPRCVSAKSQELIAQELMKFGTVDKDRNVTFEMDVLDTESGTLQKQKIDAKTAVSTLEANVDWKHFFTATVNSGTGGEVVDGVTRANNGQVDFNELAKDPAKFMEIMEKNPKLIDDAMKAMG